MPKLLQTIKIASRAAVLNLIVLPPLYAQGTPPPMLLLKDAQGATVNTLCLDSAPATLQVTGGETILEATLLGSSGTCPPGDFVQIISFGVAADGKTQAATNLNFDITAANNCSVGSFTRCLFFSWETLPGFNVPNPACTIALQGTPAITQPVTILNPSAPPTFSNAPAAEIPSFAAVQNQPPGYAWPLSTANPPAAGTSRDFVLTCNGTPQQQATVTVNFIDGTTPPRLAINNSELASVTANFGTVTQGTTAPTQTVTLRNPAATGGPAVSVTSIAAPAAPFSRTGGTCSTTFPISLNAGVSCTIVYSMATGSTGTFNQNLAVATNAPPTSRTLTLTGTVNTGGGGGGGTVADCSNRPPVVPVQDTTQTEFFQLFGTNPAVVWPGLNGASRVFVVQTNKYKALKFDTSDTPANVTAGLYEWDKNSIGNPFAAAVVALSECPGEVRPPDQNCSAPLPQNPFSTSKIQWVMEGAVNPPPPDRCVLKRNHVYYVNTIFGQSANPAQTTCTSPTACQHLVRTAHATQ